MKFIRVVIKIVLILALIITTISFIAENIVIKTFSQEILSKKVSGYFLDEIFHEIDTNKLEEIEDNIRNSKYTYEITSKFIQNVIGNVLYSKNTSLDISKEIDLLILENMPKEIDNRKIDDTKEYLTKKIVDTEKSLEENFTYTFGDYYLIILKLYKIFTNIYFRVVMLLLCIINIIALIILEKQKSLKAIQVSILITAIFTTIIFAIIKLFSNFIDQKLAGGWLSSINLSLMLAFIVIEFIISLGLFMIRIKFEFDDKEKNEIISVKEV